MIEHNTASTRDLSAAFLNEIDQIIGLSNLKRGDAVANLDYGVTPANFGADAVAFPSSPQEVASIIKLRLPMVYRLYRRVAEPGLLAGCVRPRSNRGVDRPAEPDRENLSR